MAILSGHCDGCQVQATTLQHGRSGESVSAAQRVRQVLRATREALTGALWIVVSALGTDPRALNGLPTELPALIAPTLVPRTKGHGIRTPSK